MPKQVQQVCMSSVDASAYMGPEGMLVIDREFYGIRVQDGVTPGGNLTLSSKANLADLDDPVIARENLRLGSAALLDTDTGFMLGIDNLSEIVDPEAARINIQAAQRNDNTDINTIALQQDGLRIRNVDNTFKHIIKVSVSEAMTVDPVITIFLPVEDADITLSGINTGDQNVQLTNDVTGVGEIHPADPRLLIVKCTIADQAVNEQAYHDSSIPNSAFQNHVVDQRVLEFIGGVAGVYSNPTLTIDQSGRVVSVENGSGALARQVSGNLALAHGTVFVHGFGVVPDNVKAYIICATAEFGFLPGDVLDLPIGIADLGGNKGTSLYHTVNAVTLLMDGDPVVIKQDGTTQTLVSAHWKLKFICLVFG